MTCASMVSQDAKGFYCHPSDRWNLPTDGRLWKFSSCFVFLQVVSRDLRNVTSLEDTLPTGNPSLAPQERICLAVGERDFKTRDLLQVYAIPSYESTKRLDKTLKASRAR